LPSKTIKPTTNSLTQTITCTAPSSISLSQQPRSLHSHQTNSSLSITITLNLQSIIILLQITYPFKTHTMTTSLASSASISSNPCIHTATIPKHQNYPQPPNHLTQNRTRAPFFGKSQPANKTQSAVPIFSATHHGFIQIKPSPSTLAICRLT
jgi:hypothetical protein